MAVRILPALISLDPGTVAEEIASWLTDQLDSDTRVYGVAGPLDNGRILVFLKGGQVLVVDVRAGKVEHSDG